MNEKLQIDESQIFSIDPVTISVNKDLPRQRKDLGEIEKMMESINTFGQFNPIIINRQNELIMGGRRLAACTALGIKVRACYKDTIDPVLMRELELEENIQRKSLTPAEECIAIKELVELKQSKHGKAVQGRSGGFSLSDAGELIGKTKGNVIEAIQIADMLAAFPNLSDAKTKSEIKKAYKGLQRIQSSVDALSSFKEKSKTEDRFKLFNSDAIDYMRSIPNNSIDLLLTDPPYGIDIHKNAITSGGKTGGDNTTTGIKYEDSLEYAEKLYLNLAEQSFRFTKENAHAFIFLAPSNFELIKTHFESFGWLCSPRPLIWIKQSSGQNNQPEKWFSSAYEMILFARKPASILRQVGKPDWIQCDIVSSSNRIHQAEKPVPLIKELIERVAIAGDKLCDPFMGSGAIIESACDLNLFAEGNELSIESYAIATKRMVDWSERK